MFIFLQLGLSLENSWSMIFDNEDDDWLYDFYKDNKELSPEM